MKLTQPIWEQLQIAKREQEFAWNEDANRISEIRFKLNDLIDSQMKFFEEMERLIEEELK